MVAWAKFFVVVIEVVRPRTTQDYNGEMSLESVAGNGGVAATAAAGKDNNSAGE